MTEPQAPAVQSVDSFGCQLKHPACAIVDVVTPRLLEAQVAHFVIAADCHYSALFILDASSITSRGRR